MNRPKELQQHGQSICSIGEARRLWRGIGAR